MFLLAANPCSKKSYMILSTGMKKIAGMHGGDYLGEGTYGCTLDPHPACRGNVQFLNSKVQKQQPIATVGKVFVEQKHADEEWNVALMLYKIDPMQSHFIYPTSRCDTTVASVKKAQEKRHCTNMMRTSKKQVKMIMLQNGGIALQEYMMRNMMQPVDLLQSLLPVFHGLVKLSKNGIVHHDMKFDNILYNPVTMQCRAIDFGLMVATKDALTFGGNPYIFSNYWLHPPEYRVLVSMHKHNWKHMDTAEMRQMLSSHLSIYKIRFSPLDSLHISDLILNGKIFSYCDYERSYMLFMKQLYKHKNKEGIIGYMQRFANRIDVYSLGITLLYLTMYMNTTLTTNNVEQQLQSLIRSMIHPDPRKRSTPTKCLRDVLKIVGTSSAQKAFPVIA